MVKFRNVTKKFGEIVALQDISFEIEKGEFVFITGPSGAGKTTIIKLILREIFPSLGEIEVFGENLREISSSKLPFYRQKIGVVFQDFKLLPERTVFENVALPMEIRGEKKEKIKERVNKALELVGLSDQRDLFPLQLAGGELQRACLARALIAEPQILIADEPTGNLDPTTSWKIVKLLKKINKFGITVLMTTHNIDIVNSLSERVIKIDRGKIIKDEKGGKYEII